MKVICKGHKACFASFNCPHSKLHTHKSIEYSKCIVIEGTDCFCVEDKQHTRKLKINKLNSLT